MIAAIIRWSIHNRLLVALMALLLAGWGAWSARHIPLDALPDLSDVQVIVKTNYPAAANYLFFHVTYLSDTMARTDNIFANFKRFGHSIIPR